jgi:phage terminase Nu1 subunit (DNA packaging protein)
MAASDVLVNVEQIDQYFGCSIRQVYNFASAGMPKAERGKYNRLACFQWYAKKLKGDIAAVQAAHSVGSLEYEQTWVHRAMANMKGMEATRMRSTSKLEGLYALWYLLWIGSSSLQNAF